MVRAFDIGARVELFGLSAKPELNGKHGTVEDYHPDKGRHQVCVDGQKSRVLLASKNLAAVTDGPPPDVSDAPAAADYSYSDKPSNWIKPRDPRWDEHGIFHGEMTEDMINEPTGVCRTLPGGQELMRKLMYDCVEKKEHKKEEDERKKASAKAVPPIVVLAAQADAEGVKAHLEAGWEVDARAPEQEGGWTPLQILSRATKQQPEEAVLATADVLLDAGADVNAANALGLTALHVAVEMGETAEGLARKLLARGADVDAASQKDGTTALLIACHLGRRPMVELLLDAGATADKPQHGGAAPVHICCAAGQPTCLQVLLARGATADLKMSAPGGAGSTGLVLACEKGRVQCAVHLIAAKASVNLESSVGVLPLQAACEYNHVELAKLLINAGAMVEPPLTAREGDATRQSPLYAAARRGHDECLRACIAAGADVHRINRELGTPLYAAVCGASASTVRILLRAKADVQADGGGPSGKVAPLYAACHPSVHAENGGASRAGELVECAKALLEGGALVDARGDQGRTPLHNAARVGCVALVRLLLESRADPAATTAQGETAHSLAMDLVRAHDDRAPAYQEIAHITAT